jgi:hypothetical protein
MNYVSSREIENCITTIRGRQIMVDTDLADFYETETKKLKQQVRRNIDRFPEDFMFELTPLEKHSLIQSDPRLRPLKYNQTCPMVFTELGVAMLSSVVQSPRAVQINIQIMRAFVASRALTSSQEQLVRRVDMLEKKVDSTFFTIMERMGALPDKLLERPKIGFKK